jgi:gliding motility-associated-like protein
MRAPILILLLSTVFVFVFSVNLQAQNGCIEVESILADACDNNSTSPEGLNEMFRFRTGNFPLNISEISVINGWPCQGVNSLPFNGFAQNAATVSKTIELNATITSCGLLVEPTNGDIPPNSRVLAITSYQVLASLNSFANLSDTIFIIYHDHTGEGGGHFLNYTNLAPQDQELRLQISGANACFESVTYQRGSLVNTNGGNTAQNGATVTFSIDGVPSYSNTGCTAPVDVFSANWTPPGPICSTNPIINLTNLITGTQGGTWTGQGVVGNNFNPALVSGSADVTYTVLPPNNCLTTTTQMHTIQVLQDVDASFSDPGPICGSTGTLDLNSLLTGTTGGTWSGSGVSGSTLNVSGQSGNIQITYSVGSGACSDVETRTFNIIQFSPLQITGETLYCNGEEAEPLTTIPDNDATVFWYNSASLDTPVGEGNDFVPPAGQTASYFAVQSIGSCNSIPTQVDIEFSIVAMPQGDTLLTYCAGDAIPLATVTGAGQLSWYTDPFFTNVVATGNSYQSSVGNILLYIVSNSGNCLSEALKIVITEIPLLTAQILIPPSTSLCSGEPIQLQSSEITFNSWSTGSNETSIQVTEAGTYTLTREGACNIAEDEIVITGLPVTALFEASQDSGYITLPVFLADFSINAEFCDWYVNDSLIVFNAPGTLNFSQSGEYDLKLVCENSSGCADSMEIVIKVLSDELELIVPNVFTPNGDGFNEFFQVKHNAVKTFQARVFNRWGKLMYAWEDVTLGWNGKNNDDKMPDGTYFYIINGTDIKDNAFEKRGTLMLLGQ